MELDTAQKIWPKLLKEEIARHYKKKLCFEYRLPGYMASLYKKDKGEKPWKGYKKQFNTIGYIHWVISCNKGLV
jgi:hypothetical protein